MSVLNPFLTALTLSVADLCWCTCRALHDLSLDIVLLIIDFLADGPPTEDTTDNPIRIPPVLTRPGTADIAHLSQVCRSLHVRLVLLAKKCLPRPASHLVARSSLYRPC